MSTHETCGTRGQIVFDPREHGEFVRTILHKAGVPLATMAVEPGEDLPYLRIGTHRYIGEQNIQAALSSLNPDEFCETLLDEDREDVHDG